MTDDVRLLIEGMHCQSCAITIEAALKEVSCVTLVTINFASGEAVIAGDADITELIQAVEHIGYKASLMADDQALVNKMNADKKQMQSLCLRSVVALIIAIPLFINNYIAWLPNPTLSILQWPWLTVSVVCLFALYYCAGHLYRGAWQSIKQRRATMDTLVSMAVGVAWLYSTIVVWVPFYVPFIARKEYFDTAMLLVALINFGAFLEMCARNKSTAAIKHLMSMQPQAAWVVKDGVEILEPIASISKGMIVRVKPGDLIPVDGLIVEGSSYIDESMITGESFPISKKPGDLVVAGTLNQSGSFLFEVKNVGHETTLSQIIALVKKAQNTKPKIAKIVDQVAAVFTPAVIVIAIVTAISWFFLAPSTEKVAFMLQTSIAVLVIACPCALGLATPMSIMVAIGRAAEAGVLVRNGAILQVAKKITTVIFDKTGTITKGKPECSGVFVADDISHDKLVAFAASVEQYSEHPIASSIIVYAKNHKIELLPCEEFIAIAGYGVSAACNNSNILVGNAAFMKKNAIDIKDIKNAHGDKVAQGAALVYVAVDHTIKGMITVIDQVKDDVKPTILRLKKLGIKVIMMTGDHLHVAQEIAQQLAIDTVIAEVLPQDKFNRIRKLHNNNEIVAMVGDGVNDAAALAAAHVGIAIGGGADVAIASADITLMSSSIQGVLSVIELSKRVMNNIRQNLFIAFFYNICAIPIATGLFYPVTHRLLSPVVAGAAMAISSVVVVLNANRLRLIRLSPHS